MKTSLRILIMTIDNFKCVYCGCMSEEEIMSIDHLVPLSKGGDNALDNLVTACLRCNNRKSGILLATDKIMTIKEKRRLQMETMDISTRDSERYYNRKYRKTVNYSLRSIDDLKQSQMTKFLLPFIQWAYEHFQSEISFDYDRFEKIVLYSFDMSVPFYFRAGAITKQIIQDNEKYSVLRDYVEHLIKKQLPKYQCEHLGMY